MGLSLLSRIRLVLQIRNLLNALKKEGNTVDWKKTLMKGVKDLLVTIVAVGGTSVLTYYLDPEHLKQLLGVLPQTLQLALIPLVSAGITALINLIKHWQAEEGTKE